MGATLPYQLTHCYLSYLTFVLTITPLPYSRTLKPRANWRAFALSSLSRINKVAQRTTFRHQRTSKETSCECDFRFDKLVSPPSLCPGTMDPTGRPRRFLPSTTSPNCLMTHLIGGLRPWILCAFFVLRDTIPVQPGIHEPVYQLPTLSRPMRQRRPRLPLRPRGAMSRWQWR